MYFAVRHYASHKSNKRSTRPKFETSPHPSGSASVHAGGPIDGLSDLQGELAQAGAHIEHCLTIDTA